MRNKIKLLISICTAFIFMFVLASNAFAAEIITTDWVVNKNAKNLTVSDMADGGVATVTYYSLPSNVSNNSVTLKITNYDINDNTLSIKYDSNFPVTGQNIQVEISYSSGSDENTGEDYEGGKVLTGWFDNWNVESGKTRDGHDLITMNISSYIGSKTINGIIFTFSYAGNSSEAKIINFLGVDFHPAARTPQFVTDGPIAEGSIILGKWEPDSEIGNMEYSTLENGDTTIHYSSKPTGKARITAPITGHELDLLPTLKIKYSCTKAFNLAVYYNGTSSELMPYTNFTDNDGEIELTLPKTLTKLCILVDRSSYCDSSTYPSSDPTKDVNLQFYFVEPSGREIKVVSVANNNSSSNTGSGSDTPSTPSTGLSIGAWQPDSSAGIIQYSTEADGRTKIYFSQDPAGGKGRIYAPVTGHSLSQYPVLKITYSATNEFNLAVYGNSTSKTINTYTDYTETEGILYFDLTVIGGDLTKLYLIVDRADGSSAHYNPNTYNETTPTKTIYFSFEFLTQMPGTDEEPEQPETPVNPDVPVVPENPEQPGQGETPNIPGTSPAGNIEISDFVADSSSKDVNVSTNEEGQTVVYYESAPTGKGLISANVTGHTTEEYSKLRIYYSCTKTFNLALYINITDGSYIYYKNYSGEGYIDVDISKISAVNIIYLYVDRGGSSLKYDASTYTGADPTKTVYLSFEFLA